MLEFWNGFGVLYCSNELWCVFSWFLWRWIGPQNCIGDSCKQWSS